MEKSEDSIDSADKDQKRKESAEQKEDSVEMNDSHPASTTDVKENIKNKFLVDIPEDFYTFWEFCSTTKPKSPRSALEELLNLTLMGPFDILSGRHKHIQKNQQGRRPNFLLHYRYFYDPPEFQTVLVSDD